MHSLLPGQPFYFLQDGTYQLVKSEKYSVITQIKVLILISFIINQDVEKKYGSYLNDPC